MNNFERTLRALGVVLEGDVIKGPWDNKPKPEKVSARHVFGPGEIEDKLREYGSPNRGHTFKEKPSYFEDFDDEYNGLKYSTNERALKELKKHMRIPEYDDRDLYSIDYTTTLKYPQTKYENVPSDDVYTIIVNGDTKYLCARYAQTYCRFWMKIENF